MANLVCSERTHFSHKRGNRCVKFLVGVTFSAKSNQQKLTKESGNDKNLSGIGILCLAASSVSRHINVTAVWIERTIDIAWFSGNRLGVRNLRA